MYKFFAASFSPVAFLFARLTIVHVMKTIVDKTSPSNFPPPKACHSFLLIALKPRWADSDFLASGGEDLQVGVVKS